MYAPRNNYRYQSLGRGKSASQPRQSCTGNVKKTAHRTKVAVIKAVHADPSLSSTGIRRAVTLLTEISPALNRSVSYLVPPAKAKEAIRSDLRGPGMAENRFVHLRKNYVNIRLWENLENLSQTLEKLSTVKVSDFEKLSTV